MCESAYTTLYLIKHVCLVLRETAGEKELEDHACRIQWGILNKCVFSVEESDDLTPPHAAPLLFYTQLVAPAVLHPYRKSGG